MAEEGKKKTSLFKRVLQIGLGLVVVIFLIGAIAPFFIPWNKLKDETCQALSKKIHHTVSIESIQFNPFTGIRLKGIRVENGAGFSKQPFFSNEEALVHYSLLSLLAGRLVLSQIEFLQPQILIEKNTAGKFNFSDMSAPAAPETKPATKSEAGGSAPEAKKSGSFPVLVTSLKINDGKFSYHDQTKNKTSSIDKLNVQLLGFSLAGGGSSQLRVQFTLETEGKKIPLELDAQFRMAPSFDGVDLQRAAFTFPGFELNASGSIKSFASLLCDIAVNGKLDLAGVLGDLPPSLLAKFPPDLKAKGDLGLEAKVQGGFKDYANLKIKGKLSFHSIGVNYATYPALSDLRGDIDISESELKMPGLEMQVGGQPLKIALAIQYFGLNNLMAGVEKLKANFNYQVTSPRLVLDPFLALGGAASEGPGSSRSSNSSPSSPEKAVPEKLLNLSTSVPAGLSGRGKIEVDSVQMKKVVTGKLVQNLSLEKKQVDADLSLAAFGGNLGARALANLAAQGPTYSFSAKLTGLKLQDLVNEYADSFPEKQSLQDVRNKIFANLAFNAVGTGKGVNGTAILKYLDAKGAFNLTQAKLSHLDMMQKIGKSIPYPAVSDVLTRDINFDFMQSDFRMQGGKFAWNNFKAGSGADGRAGDLYLEAQGFVIPAADVDMHLNLHFNPRVVTLQGGLQDAFADSKGWPSFDIAYYGPSFKAAKADFSQGLKKAAGQAAQKQLDQVKKKAQDYLQQQGQNLMKNLFGH